MKIKTYILIFIILNLMNSDAFSYGGANASSGLSATDNAGMAQLSGTLGAVASVTQAVKHFQKCSPKRVGECIKGALNLAQAALLNKGAKNANAAATHLGGMDYKLPNFNPQSLTNFCSNGQSCTPSDMDKILSDFNTAFKTGSVDEYKKALGKLDDKMAGLANDFAKNGVNVDLENGVVTDSSGNPIDTSGASASLSDGLASELQSKLDSAMKAASESIKTDGSSDAANRSIASTGDGSGSGSSLKSGLDLGLKNGLDSANGSGKKSSFEDRKKKFLAGLSNSDATKDGFGVEGDNLFEMLQRRYLKKVQKKEFISSSSK